MLPIETICALILSAGMSTRMRDFKPLVELRGKTLIENTVDSVFSGGAAFAVVVTGLRGDELEFLLKRRYKERVICAYNKNYETSDMLESIRIGCRKMPPCDAFFLLPGDMPVTRGETFRALINRRDGHKGIIFPTLHGRRKHPPLIDSRFIPEILAYNEDGGLRGLWKYHEREIIELDVDDIGVDIDLDTREELNECRKIYEPDQRRENVRCSLQRR